MPAAEEAHLYVRTADPESFFTLHGVEDRFTGVLLRPDTGQAGGFDRADVDAGVDRARHARLDARVQSADGAKIVVLPVRGRGSVGIGGGTEAELVGIEPLDVLKGKPVLQRLAGVAADDMR